MVKREELEVFEIMELVSDINIHENKNIQDDFVTQNNFMQPVEYEPVRVHDIERNLNGDIQVFIMNVNGSILKTILHESSSSANDIKLLYQFKKYPSMQLHYQDHFYNENDQISIVTMEITI